MEQVHCARPDTAPARLIGQLDRLLAGRVAVISAPAGHGKESLVRAWLGAHPELRHRCIGSARELDAAAETLAAGDDERLLVLVLAGEEILADTTAVTRSLALSEAHPQVRILFVGRRRPEAPLGSLAARGQLVDLDGSQLAWTRQEVADELAPHSPDLSEQALETIVTMTRGWPAIVRILAQQELDWSAADRITRLVDSYVSDEVLAGLDDDDLELLHQLAALPELDPLAATWLTGRGDAAAQLTRLQSHGLPITWGADNSIRLNPVLREHLTRRLVREDPELGERLTERATLWLRNRGRYLDAVALAVEARMLPLAWQLAAEFLTVNLHRDRLDEALPRLTELIPPGWEMDAVRSVSAGLVNPAAMIAQVAALGPSLSAGDLTGRLGHVCLALGTVRRAGYPADIDVSSAMRLAEQVEDEDLHELHQAQLAAVRLERGLWLLHHCRMAEAQDVLLTALGLARVVQVPWVLVTALSALAFIHAEQGSTAQAALLADEALEHGEQTDFSTEAVTEYALLAKVLVAVDTGNLAAARHWVDRLEARTGHPRETDAIRTHVLALHEIARDEPGRARDLVNAYRDQPHPPASPLDQLVTGMAAFNAFMADDDLGAAGQELTDLLAQPLGERLPSLVVPQARLALAQGRPEQAHQLLAPLAGSNRPLHDHAKYTLFALMVFGTAADQLHRREEATKAFQRASVLAARLGLDATNARHTRIAGSRPKIPLTEAERTVLASLDSSRTLGETADQLFISLNTLKTHLRRIYKKLGVANREEAIERARILGLRG
ncbi:MULTISPECIES: LuxR C-terminal-related transcriptional regulator [unclassified Luteococcus]|uniref:LuxR C-terminal-related transcriptional regulator n=1 Tax=unclassified Luteococcus TaxID=2639923 RepID=UPI00313CEC1C